MKLLGSEIHASAFLLIIHALSKNAVSSQPLAIFTHCGTNAALNADVSAKPIHLDKLFEESKLKISD